MVEILQTPLAWLDALVRLGAALTGVSPQFLRFAVVGTLGFCVDTATVYATRAPLGLYAAGLAGFLVAGTANWGFNRLWTFRHNPHQPAHRQWLSYLAANSVGVIVNRGLFFILITVSPLCHREPVLPIVAGSLAGLVFNYLLSKKYVFR